MARFAQLARRAWEIRHDREALVAGFDRYGIRVPGSGSYRHRSPRVGVLIDRAWAGHVSRSLHELEALRAAGGRVGADATLALADWHVTHQRPELAMELLESRPRRSTEATGLHFEAWSLVDTSAPPPQSSRRESRRARRHPHVAWLVANAESDRLAMWNGRLRALSVARVHAPEGTLSSLTTDPLSPVHGPLVTVIVPMHDAVDTIGYALRSVLNQSWVDLEVIVVDDASRDDSSARARDIARNDSRVRVLSLDENVGAYGARNRALAEARGEFVTVHDADDWAHPERIRLQMEHLLADSSASANVTSLVRATPDLVFTRRAYITNQMVGINYSSLLFRRSVVDAIGPWDTVRVGADSEFVDRIVDAHGPGSVAKLARFTPMAVAANVPSSLIRSRTTGISSALLSTGTRRYYHLAASLWHASDGFRSDLPAHRTDDRTPFPVPSSMRRRTTPEHLDVVMMSDLALPGGTTASNLNEIAAQERFGLTTGLLHNRNPQFRDTGPHPKFFAASSDRTRLLTFGDEISCTNMVIKYPPTAREIPDVFPQVQVLGRIAGIINQTPFTSYVGERQRVYDLVHCNDEIARAFGRPPLWFCSGPAVRRVLHEHHESDLRHIELSPVDWPEIIDVDAWRRDARPSPSDVVRIGRHGRDDEWKWPGSRSDILAAYPADPRFEVRVLGGADVARRRLGSLPGNWQVLPFDSRPPRDWLAELDVFVYFPHANMVEAFGRTVLEALAVGVPVVCDTRFSEVFGEAVIACSADAAMGHVDRLMSDDAMYDDHVRRGWKEVETRFSFEAHRRRLEALGR